MQEKRKEKFFELKDIEYRDGINSKETRQG